MIEATDIVPADHVAPADGVRPADDVAPADDDGGGEDDRSGGETEEDDAGWDDARHWHRAVPPVVSTSAGVDSVAPVVPEDDSDTDGETVLPEAALPGTGPEVPGPGPVETGTGPIVLEPGSAVPESGTEAESDLVPAVQPASMAAGQDQWREIFSTFVDDPRGSVTEAAALAEREIKALEDRLRRHQADLRDMWQSDSAASTEDFRLALKGYRDFSRTLESAAQQLS